MAIIHQARRFFNFYFKADTKYAVHSPFVYDFVSHILDDRRYYYKFDTIEQLRRQLRSDHTILEIKDFGAGSKVIRDNKRKVSDIVKHSATPRFFSQLLFKIVQHYKPRHLLELGTSLGISAMYMAAADSQALLTTLEGDPAVSRYAKQNFKNLNFSNIQLVQGDFKNTLPVTLKNIPLIDCLFVDGNHQWEATISYFEKCLQHTHARSIFIFDDIHWSDGMEAAWEVIRNHPEVRLTIDIFRFGIVFFNPDIKEQQHFRLVPARWKPWQIW